MNIVVLDGHTVNPGDLSWQGLRQLGQVTIYPRSQPDQIRLRIREAEAILNNKCIIDADLIAKAPNLQYIGMLSTGYDVLDLAAIEASGIVATNIPAYSTYSVAQQTFALILEITNQVGLHNQSVQAGEWSACPDFSYWLTPLTELQGKTIGLIGLGQIGQAVARIALAFGMRVKATICRTSLSPDLVGRLELTSLDSVLNSDIVSLHCPLTKQTENLINHQTLAKMPQGAILINTARGKLIQANDLAEALKSGHIQACGLDVADPEPITPDNPLLGLENCFITPHLAWATTEARKRLIDLASQNLKAFIQGRPINQIKP